MAKLSDFGLAKQTDMVQLSATERIPVRWFVRVLKYWKSECPGQPQKSSELPTTLDLLISTRTRSLSGRYSRYLRDVPEISKTGSLPERSNAIRWTVHCTSEGLRSGLTHSILISLVFF